MSSTGILRTIDLNKEVFMKVLLSLVLTFVAQASLAIEGPCEKKAVSVVASIEKLMNPQIGKLQFKSQTILPASTQVSNVKVLVQFSDRSSAIYDLSFNEINGNCFRLNTLRKVSR